MSFRSQAQNLVPNPSFEIYDTCPHGGNELENATGWKTIYNTPDYFNSCAHPSVSVPTNALGFQEPKELNEHGYAGIITDFQWASTEMFGIRLLQPLQIGETYYASFYYNPAQRISGLLRYNCFTNKIGVKLICNFTDTVGLGDRLIDNNPKLFSNLVLTDTLNWTLFSGSFIADSAYTFLVIGNFFKNENINHICYDSTAQYSYTYIDHVCLSINKNECFDRNNNGEVSFSIYPNPASGVFNIVDNFDQEFSEKEIKIYNVIGQLVFKFKFIDNKFTIDLSNFSKGLYIISINDNFLKLLLI